MTDQMEAARQLASLNRLLELAEDLSEAIDDHLQSWGSARLAHARPSYLVSAIQREKDTLARRVERRSELAVQRAADAEQREYTVFEREMAANRAARGLTTGTTPESYRQLQQEAAARMVPQSQDELDRVMREAK